MPGISAGSMMVNLLGSWWTFPVQPFVVAVATQCTESGHHWSRYTDHHTMVG